MNNPTHHTCPTCGHTWLHGQHGGHSCATLLAVTIAEQALEIERLSSACAAHERHREAVIVSSASAALGADGAAQVSAGGVDGLAALATLERFVETVRECYQLASSYSGCLDSVDEQGGDDHEDPICAVFHRLYYAMFDGDKALEQGRTALTAPAPNHGEQVREGADGDRPGYDALWLWFSLSRSSYAVLPRVMMHDMPDAWQADMARLLDEWDSTWVNQPNIGSRVQIVDSDGRLVKTPAWVLNYRNPDLEQLTSMRAAAPSAGSQGGDV